MKKFRNIIFLIAILLIIGCTRQPSIENEKSVQVQGEIDIYSCNSDNDCGMNVCMGCINKRWEQNNRGISESCLDNKDIKEEYEAYGLNREEYLKILKEENNDGWNECKCIEKKCVTTNTFPENFITQGKTLRINEEKLPINVNVEKDASIIFTTVNSDELYKITNLESYKESSKIALSKVVIKYKDEEYEFGQNVKSKNLGGLNIYFNGILTVAGEPDRDFAILMIKKSE